MQGEKLSHKHIKITLQTLSFLTYIKHVIQGIENSFTIVSTKAYCQLTEFYLKEIVHWQISAPKKLNFKDEPKFEMYLDNCYFKNIFHHKTYTLRWLSIF